MRQDELMRRLRQGGIPALFAGDISSRERIAFVLFAVFFLGVASIWMSPIIALGILVGVAVILGLLLRLRGRETGSE